MAHARSLTVNIDLPETLRPRRGCSSHLLVVETQTSGSFMRANVSRGPPRHAAQDGLAGGTQPAAAKISAAVLPSQPGTGSPYTSAHTCGLQGAEVEAHAICNGVNTKAQFLLAHGCMRAAYDRSFVTSQMCSNSSESAVS